MQKIGEKIKNAFSITEEHVLKLYSPISTLFKTTPVSQDVKIQTDVHENYQTKTQSFCAAYTSEYNGTTCIQQACCKTPNCIERCIDAGKSFFSCLLNLLCYPFIPCANIFLPSYCQHTAYTNGESVSGCSSAPNCMKNTQESTSCYYCCRSQQCMLVWASILLTIVFVILWSLTQDSEMLIKGLKYIDNMDAMTSIFFLILLFTLVSFPMVWGYLPLNLTAGYMYGFLYSIPVVVLAVTIGVAIAHFICKKYLATYVMQMLRNRQNFNQLEAILQVIDGSSGLKVIALTRLTPIPFGFQNGLFAVSNVNMKYYLLASSIGLFPTQVLNCYIGSQFRSMEEIVEQNTPGGYIVFIAQIVIGIVLMMFVIRHARKELANAIENSANQMATMTSSYNEVDKDETTNILEDVRCTQPLSPKIQEKEPFLNM